MRFRLYREHGALNSRPIFDAFEQGVKSLGHEITNSSDGIPVIWSVLWAGRMSANRAIYKNCIDKKLPIVIIEVGNLSRGKTWRICLNHIHSHGIFGNDDELDLNRPEKLGVLLKPLTGRRREEILIASQHQQSLQWEGMPPMTQWISDTIQKIKQHTSRKIVVRPHPRSPLNLKIPNVVVETPRLIPGTYDDFDIDYNYHCVINHNSGPAVQAAINGVPIICDSSSLAGSLTGNFSDIDSISLPDRQEWFLKLCHTEWTVNEIAQGIPLKRLESKLI